MRSAHILIVGPAHPLRGGMSTFNERLARALNDAGHRAEICSFSFQYPGFLFPGTSQYTDVPPPRDLEIFSRIHSLNPINWVGTARFIRRLKPDMLFTRYWLPFMAPALGSVHRMLAGSGIRRYAMMDNFIPHERRPGDRLLTRYFTGSCDGFFCMSAEVERQLNEKVRKPVTRLHHPVYDHTPVPESREAALRQLGLDAKSKYLLFFGFIRAYKGLDLLLDAWSDPVFAHCGYKLIVAGEFYEDQKPYLDLLRRPGMANRVVLMDRYISDADMGALFCATDLVAQPYRSATQSGVTLAAYAQSKPVLVTRVGGLEELVEHGVNGYAVEPEVPAIKKALLDFIEGDRAAEMAKKVAPLKQKYSWASFAKAVAQVALSK